ncbi:MAG: heparinase II/III family protein [Planctomycetia bacterium]|nr:heparinase II/III family protein [Planctomycetia bacterium]
MCPALSAAETGTGKTVSSDPEKADSAPQTAPPTFDQLKARIRSDHPRLFINQETLPRFREYAQTVCKDRLAKIKKELDHAPSEIKLEYRLDLVDIVDGRMVFKRPLGDQNAVLYGVRNAGGIKALECAIIYLATGEKIYFERAMKYLRLNIEFIELAKRSKVLPEWYHTERLSALIAWDWLYNEMSESQRRDFIVPMLEYIDFMRKPGYLCNTGGKTTGNYGEAGLRWFAGLAAFRSGYCDDLAENLLKIGYQTDVDMMNYREETASGRGLLTSITAGYSFGAYPWASYNFLHTLRSAANFDGTDLWKQMADYGDYFYWMAIPSDTVPNRFLDFGWGDASHYSNAMNSDFIYTHLAQALHFYGKKSPELAQRIRAVIETLPEKSRVFQGTKSYPYYPFILFDFDPNVKNQRTPKEILGGQIAQFFPSYGLMNVRSGLSSGDTFASFKAGAKNDGHQHFDENTFIIHKKGFQALDTGTRGQARQHLIYYPQTVAHNGILIRMKEEPLAWSWYPANAPKIDQKPFADGGQNRKIKTKSLGFEQTKWYAVSAGDATQCYSKEKCTEAVRFFVFISPDYFVVYDRVKSVKPDQEKVFLLHTQNEPREENHCWRSDAGDGSLFLQTLLPEACSVKRIGGPDHEFETNGVNYPLPNADTEKLYKSVNWFGRWRLEITTKDQTEYVRFLHLIQVGDKSMIQPVPAVRIGDSFRDGIEFTTKEKYKITVLFTRKGSPKGSIRIVDDQGKRIIEKKFFESKKENEDRK